jgi:hypothetical protein
MDNNQLAAKFVKLAPLARCWAETDGTFYVRYATGFCEYLSRSQVLEAIRFIEEGPRGG